MGELSYKAAADHLNVSPATIKNWTRQGLLSTDSQSNPLESDILQLKNKISAHKSARLSSRANKSSAVRKFIPTEYIENTISRKDVNRLSMEINALNVDPQVFLLTLSIILIDKAGLIDEMEIISDGLPIINHEKLSLEIISWHKDLKTPPIIELINKIASITIPEQRDTMGLIYQMLQNEGRKSKKGSYYTPSIYADEILDSYGSIGQKFLDPCCGSGIFLLSAAHKYGSPENIYGWDTDVTAVHLARINLMLYFRELQFEPQIYIRNCLIENIRESFDLIATNPPWGNHLSLIDRAIIEKRFPSVKTGESFSYFIEAGLELLTKTGTLCYILPEALLKVKTHQDIRKRILENVQIKFIKYLGKPFDRVQTEVIRMDMGHKKNSENTVVFRKNKIYSVNSCRFSLNSFYLFDFNCNSQDYKIIGQIYDRQHQTLKNNALWILGIVSGNNNRFISSKQKKDYKPFISGPDISAFRIHPPKRYIYFKRDVLQQSAPGEYYERSPKIVYKFITDKPLFAIDRSGFTTLNSANSFFPYLEVPVEIIIALFNSSLFQFLFKKKFRSVKILKSHLEQLPIPQFTREEMDLLLALVWRIESAKDCEYTILKENIDDFIFQYFTISDRDRKYILESL